MKVVYEGLEKPVGRAQEKAVTPADLAPRLKLMGNSERLLMLLRMAEGEASVSELVRLTGLSQPAVSQHLAILRDQAVVEQRHVAQMRYYRLADGLVKNIIHSLCALGTAKENFSPPANHHE